jgi:phosphocarrier protein HPr
VSQQSEKTVRIVNELGLHLRAAGALVQLASRFKCEIVLRKEDTEANAKSIMSVLSLAAGKGATLVVAAQGEDAQGAVTGVCELIEGGFNH